MTGACPDDRDLTVFFSLAPAPLSGAEPVARPGELRPAPGADDRHASQLSGWHRVIHLQDTGGRSMPS
jgi:hypothetical protein